MRALLLGFLFAAGLLAPVARAHADEGDFAEIVSELDLTAEQRAKVVDAVYKARAARVDINARLERARLDLRHALGADVLDEKAVARAVDALNAATAELVHNRVDQVLALRKILTPPQFTELRELWQDGRDGHDDVRVRLRERWRDEREDEDEDEDDER